MITAAFFLAVIFLSIQLGETIKDVPRISHIPSKVMLLWVVGLQIFAIGSLAAMIWERLS